MNHTNHGRHGTTTVLHLSVYSVYSVVNEMNHTNHGPHGPHGSTTFPPLPCIPWLTSGRPRDIHLGEGRWRGRRDLLLALLTRLQRDYQPPATAGIDSAGLLEPLRPLTPG